MSAGAGCKARQYSDQMYCGDCRLTWDINDPEPPSCNPLPAPVPPTQEKLLFFKAVRTLQLRYPGTADYLNVDIRLQYDAWVKELESGCQNA